MSSARWLLALSLIYGVACGGLAQPVAAAATRPLAVAPDNFAEATLTLNEAFFNTVLDAVFRDFPAPSYSIAGAQPVALPDLPDSHQAAHALPQCASVVSLARSVGATRTAVRLGEGRIAAPIAFTGSYKPPFGCIRFQGWADTEMTLEFNQAQQTLNLRVAVKSVRLDNVPSLLNAPLKGLVQDAIDQRINPLPLLKAEQLSAQLPLAALGGTLQVRAREVRPEITPGALHLHIFYEFSRAK